MPTFNSATYDAQIGGNPRNRLDASVMSAEVRFAEIEYKILGTEASGDILKLFQIQNGVIVYPEQSAVISEGIGGTGVTLTAIGDQAKANRYSASAVALTAAGVVALTVIPADRVAAVKTDSTNNVIQATLGGTLPATVGKKFWLKLAYRIS
jgi:hypothetical protein